MGSLVGVVTSCFVKVIAVVADVIVYGAGITGSAGT